MPSVTLQPFGAVVALVDGESVFEAAKRAGIPVPTACGGKGTCGLCRVKVLDGEKSLPAYTAEEKRHIGNTYFISRLRLSCRLRGLTGDATLLLPDARKPPGAP